MKNYPLKKIKRRYAYTYREISSLLDVRPRTIMDWVKHGLELIDYSTYPRLVLGKALKSFLHQKQQSRRVTLQHDEFYCLHCRKGVVPISQTLKESVRNKMGKGKRLIVLQGLCPHCRSFLNRFTTRTDFQIVGQTDFLPKQKGLDELPLFKVAR